MLRLNDLYVGGFIDMEKYKADYAALEAQIVKPTKPKKIDLTAVKKFLEGNYLNDNYPLLTDIEKQALWRSVIKEIRMSGKTIVDIVFL